MRKIEGRALRVVQVELLGILQVKLMAIEAEHHPRRWADADNRLKHQLARDAALSLEIALLLDVVVEMLEDVPEELDVGRYRCLEVAPRLDEAGVPCELAVGLPGSSSCRIAMTRK